MTRHAKHGLSLKDPKGGLTAAGRKYFQRKQGSKLKPGVKKPISQMSPADMRRKGSWAVRFYGRSPLPKLVDKDGKPRALLCRPLPGASPCRKLLQPRERSQIRGVVFSHAIGD